MVDTLTIADLKEFFKCDGMSMRDAMPAMQELRDKHGLTDRQSLDAFRMAKNLFDSSHVQ